MKRITILTSPFDSSFFDYENVGLLFECAKDSEFGTKYKNTIPINTLIGNREEKRLLACKTTTKLLEGEPYLRNIPQLTIFKEVISAELHKIFHLLHLHDFLLNQKIIVCEFISPCWWGSSLKAVTKLIGSSLEVKAPNTIKQNKLRNSFNRLYSSNFSLDLIYKEFRRALDQIDPFKRRFMGLKNLVQKKFEYKKYWFYTTAVNYTNIALSYENYFPEPFCFLAGNEIDLKKSFGEKNHILASFYDFALSEFIPSESEIKAGAASIIQHISNVSLDSLEAIALNIFMKSDWMKLFLSRLFPMGLFSSAVFDRWITMTKPSALVVGNQVYEGYAIYKARENSVPTILLQHGVIADYYKYLDYPIDCFIVRGPFFKDRLSIVSQKRAVLLNPPKEFLKKEQKELKDTIVFLTTPLHGRYMSLEVDIEPILTILIQRMSSSNKKLIVRVHPLESINEYKKKFLQILKTTSSKLKITYSQNNNLMYVLQHASAVITFGSTIFLDCIKYGVPIIGFNWIDFSLKDSLKRYGICYFAENLDHFEKLVGLACNEKLDQNRENIHYFLSDSSVDEIRSKIEKIVKVGK